MGVDEAAMMRISRLSAGSPNPINFQEGKVKLAMSMSKLIITAIVLNDFC